VTPVTTSAEGEGSWGRKGEDSPLGTSKINAVGGVSGTRETQEALKKKNIKKQPKMEEPSIGEDSDCEQKTV